MLEIGKYHTLEVLRSTSVGLYLSNGLEDVLLPIRYIPDGAKEMDMIDVFVYLDNENRPVATTLKPFATVGEFAFLEVKDITEHGAFLDWGIAKDLFVPYAEQRGEMKIGRKYLVFILIDEQSQRIFGTCKWMQYLTPPEAPFEEKQEVSLLIAEKTDLGFRAIINNMHEGLLYRNEIFEDIEAGDRKKGFIKSTRPDGKIDLVLQPTGYGHITDIKPKLLEMLKAGNGKLSLGDKSSPEDIYDMLKISKKAFKKAVGGLYKEKLIEVGELEIKLIGQSAV